MGVKGPTQGHTVKKWWSQTGLSGWLSPEAILITKASTISRSGDDSPMPFTLLVPAPIAGILLQGRGLVFKTLVHQFLTSMIADR